MKRVLMVAYLYPPFSQIGALRAAKLAKYLPDYGWEPTVLTVKPEKNIVYNLKDELVRGNVVRTRDFDLTVKLRDLLGIEIDIEKQREITSGSAPRMKLDVLNILKNIYRHAAAFPDPQLMWYFIIKYSYRRYLKDMSFDLIWTTSRPRTSNLVGCFFKKTYQVPWVADFRDLWTLNNKWRRISPLYELERQLEIRTLLNCDIITTVSEPLAEQMRSLHKSPVHIIENGFDDTDYPENCTYKKRDKIHIVYTGRIYPGKAEPRILFDAIGKLKREGLLTRDDIVIDFYGKNVEVVGSLAQKQDVTDMVKLHGLVPFEQAIKAQIEADILLLLLSTSEEKGVYTGKFFEYLGARRPVLAFGPKGGVVDLQLKETGAGFLVDVVDETMIVLRDWIEEYRNADGLTYTGKDEIINRFSRKAMAKKFAGLFDEVSATNNKGGKI